jgi:hypothetical protein
MSVIPGKFRVKALANAPPVPPGSILRQSTCDACAAGTYSKGNATTCDACDPWKISEKGAFECTACAAGTYPSPINMRRLCRRNLFGSQCFDFDIGVPIGRVIRVQYHNGPIGRGCVDLVDGNLGTLEKMRTGNTVDNDLDRLSSCFDPQTRFGHIVKIFHRCTKPFLQNIILYSNIYIGNEQGPDRYLTPTM